MKTYHRDPALSGYRPDPARLATAERVNDWTVIPSRSGDGYALRGRQSADGRLIETADLLVLDAEAGYALTHAGGLWRLGAPWPLSPQEVRSRQIEAACADRDRVEGGWQPSAAELADAPILHEWAYTSVRGAGLLSLGGFLGEEDGYRVGEPERLTSPVLVLAYDGERGWARTWSRWYRLGQRADGEDVEPTRAEHYTSPMRAATGRAVVESQMRSPPADLEPERELYDDVAGWRKLAAWFEKEQSEPRKHDPFIIYLALRLGCSPSDAYLYSDSFEKSRLGLRGFN